MRLRWVGDVVEAAGWGPGAEWLLDRVPELLGAGDDAPEIMRMQLWVLRYYGCRG